MAKPPEQKPGPADNNPIGAAATAPPPPKNTAPKQPTAKPIPGENGPQSLQKPEKPYTEIGVGGLKQNSGYVWEDFVPVLRGILGVRTFQTMADGDATCGAILTAIRTLLLSADWTEKPADDSPAALEAAEFAKTLREDTSHSWRDFLSEVLTMLEYGWAYFEMVFKVRKGPEQVDPAFRSKFKDGAIGIRKLARRAQDSLQRWEFDEKGGLKGMWQLPITGGNLCYMPIEKSLLFRTRVDKNNPEGRSLLRNAYMSWWRLQSAETIEAIGIERELAGLPVVSIPAKFITSTDPADVAVYQQYVKMARDVKFNEQSGLVLPSDTYRDSQGNPTQTRLVQLDLLKAGGPRAIDTNTVITRYQQSIARSVLADFLMLGTGGGARASGGARSLGENKSEIFTKSLEYLLNEIAAVWNRYCLPRVWSLNGFDPLLMPTLEPGKISQIDLAELGSYIQTIAAAGAPLFPDDVLEDYVRDAGGLPSKGEAEASSDA